MMMRGQISFLAFCYSQRFLFKPKHFSTTAMSSQKSLVVDPFCFRQFDQHEQSQKYLGTIFSLSVSEFETTVNERYDESLLQDGYAPFCKHLFIKNDFTDAQVNVLPITVENEHNLRTEYQARNEKELPVLSRYFPKNLVGDNLPVAKYLDLILYSREQIQKENAAQGGGSSATTSSADSSGTIETAPWGIVSIKAQDVDHELPMTPITAMRNALGKEEGGSGIPINREDYLKAVAYWKDHATVS